MRWRASSRTSLADTDPLDLQQDALVRQLVRAHDILSDDEQRAAYDQLLALALREPDSQSKRTAIYETIRNLASNTIAATIIAGVLVASYALFGQISEAPAISEKVVEVAPRQPIEFAALAPIVPSTVQSDAIARVEPRDAHADTRTLDEVTTTAAVTGTAWPADRAEPIPNIDLAPNLALNDAKSYRIRGIFAYRDGNLSRALSDFDMAIQRDPNFAEAYVDRGIVLYRLRQFDRAFADMTRAKRIEGANRTAPPVLAPPPRRTPPVRVRDALNIAASDRYLDVPIQSTPSEKRR